MATSPVPELEAQVTRLKEKIAQCREQIKATDNRSERLSLKGKITVYNQALADIQVQIDHYDPPVKRKARKAASRRINMDAFTYDWLERAGTTWSDIEGHTWQQVQAGDFVQLGASVEQLQQWMAEGSERLTPKQKLYIDAYYNDGLSIQAIAELHGVNKSTVARVIKSGIKKMQAWVDSKHLVMDCTSKDGFDWAAFLKGVTVMSNRQRQLLMLVASGVAKSKAQIASKLEVDKTVVTHTVKKGTDTCKRLKASGVPTALPKIREWDNATKQSLALETGMPLNFYYRFCFRGERYGGLSRYYYEMAKRMYAGIPREDVAREMGISVRSVTTTYYRIRKMIRLGLAYMPYETNTVANGIDAETYVKLQRLVTGRC